MNSGSDVHVENRTALGGGIFLGAGSVGLGRFLRGCPVSGRVGRKGRNGADGTARLGLLHDRAGACRTAEAGDRSGTVTGDVLRAVCLNADIHVRDSIRIVSGGEGGQCG